MGSETILVVEMIIALLGLIDKHGDANAIKEEEIDAELAKVRARFKAKDPSKLPDQPGG
jgi:hypothetical protein